MIIVEFYGGPGSGKSTTASRLWSVFKSEGIECEFCREYAQDAIYAGKLHQLDSQFIISANQYNKYKDLERSGIGLVFSDTSLLLSEVYGVRHPTNEKLVELLEILHRDFITISIFVHRVKPFKEQGRVHNEHQAIELSNLIEAKLGPFDLEIEGTNEGIVQAYRYLKQRLLRENLTL